MNIGVADHLRERASESGRRFTAGVQIGIVTNNNDTEGLGRVRVRFPELSGLDDSFWARVATPMAGNGYGAYFLPEIDDEVLVMFKGGDVHFPYVIGSLWNGKDKAPADNRRGDNNLRVIKSRHGHLLVFDDDKDRPMVKVVDASGKNSIVIDTANNTITITADKDIVLAAPRGTITMQGKHIIIGALETSTLTAGTSMNVEADAKLTVSGATVDINC